MTGPDTAGRDRAIHDAWRDGATFDDLCARYEIDRPEVRRIVFARQLDHSPGTDLVLASAAVRDGEGAELVARAARHLPTRFHGDKPPAPGSPQHVIDTWLPASAKRLILRGKSEHTLRMYLSGFGWWVKFAEANRLTILPAPQNGMIRMLDAWELLPVHVGCPGPRRTKAKDDRDRDDDESKKPDKPECRGHRPSPSAVWIWYSAMKWFHGLGEPPLPWEGGVKLSDAIAGYIKQLKDEGWRRTQAPRMYPDDLRAVIDALDAMPATRPEDPVGAVGDDLPVWIAPARVDMIRALILAGFYTGGRASDLARYRISDVARFPGGLELTLSRSKATKGDRNEEHRTIHTDATRPPQYCGMRAVERWLARLSADGITRGALFRPVHKTGVIVRGEPDGLAYMLDVTGVSRSVRLAAKAAWQRSGKTILHDWPQVTIHTLRRSRVQQLLEDGADVWDVETELGWAHGGAIKFYRAQVKRQSAEAANARGML